MAKANTARVEDAGSERTTRKTFQIDQHDTSWEDGGKRGRGGQSIYPLDDLQVGQSFHLSADEAKDAVGTLSSSVSSLKRKYQTDRPIIDAKTGEPKVRKVRGGKMVTVYEMERDFKVVRVGENDRLGPGARCKRTK